MLIISQDDWRTVLPHTRLSAAQWHHYRYKSTTWSGKSTVIAQSLSWSWCVRAKHMTPPPAREPVFTGRERERDSSSSTMGEHTFPTFVSIRVIALLFAWTYRSRICLSGFYYKSAAYWSQKHKCVFIIEPYSIIPLKVNLITKTSFKLFHLAEVYAWLQRLWQQAWAEPLQLRHICQL